MIEHVNSESQTVALKMSSRTIKSYPYQTGIEQILSDHPLETGVFSGLINLTSLDLCDIELTSLDNNVFEGPSEFKRITYLQE